MKLVARSKFQEWDLNGDGRISKEELCTGMCKEGVPMQDAEDVFKFLDGVTQKNGEITEEEFIQ